jgi:cyclophilin family peptidyl-prolyl cis-trans isomerase
MGPETRTTQVFINLRSNQVLDKDGFAPFAMVIEGMEVVEKLYAGHGQSPDQSRIERQGNTYLKANFPKLDYITRATIV